MEYWLYLSKQSTNHLILKLNASSSQYSLIWWRDRQVRSSFFSFGFSTLQKMKFKEQKSNNKHFIKLIFLSLCFSGPNRGHYIAIVKSHDFWLLFDDDIVEVSNFLIFYFSPKCYVFYSSLFSPSFSFIYDRLSIGQISRSSDYNLISALYYLTSSPNA